LGFVPRAWAADLAATSGRFSFCRIPGREGAYKAGNLKARSLGRVHKATGIFRTQALCQLFETPGPLWRCGWRAAVPRLRRWRQCPYDHDASAARADSHLSCLRGPGCPLCDRQSEPALPVPLSHHDGTCQCQWQRAAAGARRPPGRLVCTLGAAATVPDDHRATDGPTVRVDRRTGITGPGIPVASRQPARSRCHWSLGGVFVTDGPTGT
jgi:hypothetical protein